MKNFLVVSLLVICSTHAFSQWARLPMRVEVALSRIEQAFRSANPASIEDMLQSGIIMRLDDSLYQGISSIYALDKLKKYFADKDSIDFRFGLPGNGTMIYSHDSKRDTVNVDVWLKRSYDDIEVYAINISNHPLATVFYDFPKNKDGSK